MRSLSKAEFDALPLGDCELVSIEWLQEGRDLRIVLASATDRRQLLFRWTTDLRIKLNQGAFGVSPLLTFDVTAQQRSTTGFEIVFDFGGAPNGEISFHCHEIVSSPQAEPGD